MTETQALKLLQAVLSTVHDDWELNPYPIRDTGYDGPLPYGVDDMDIDKASLWLRLSIARLELGS